MIYWFCQEKDGNVLSFSKIESLWTVRNVGVLQFLCISFFVYFFYIYLCGMKIVLAFDSYKGCLSAADVCAAAREGVLSVCPDAEVVSVPLSDGGEGLVECFLRLGKGKKVSVPVHGPLMEEVEATYALSHDGETAYMEMASACGLTLVAEEKRNVMDATTYGLGEMMADAWSRGVRHIVLGIGGSATCDAGMGMLEALRSRYCLFDDSPKEVLPLPLDRRPRRRSTDVPDVGQPMSPTSVLTVACDVDNPLYGESGAAHVFAPQKGATPEQVEMLDRRLRAFALATEELGLARPEDAFRPGAGAAGGLGYALLTYLGAELRSGIEIVLDECGFDSLLLGADVVLTGEGCSDGQTVHGKVAAGVLNRAKKRGVKTVLMSGQVKEKEALMAGGFERLVCVNEGDERPLEVLMRPEVARENIRRTCQRLMEDFR